MRKLLFVIFICSFLPLSSHAATTPTKKPTVAVKKAVLKKKVVVKKPKIVAPKNLVGKIATQTENQRLWYIAPDTKQRYFLKNVGEVQSVVETLKVMVPSATLNKIPKTLPKTKSSIPIAAKPYLGKFVTTVEDPTTVWYIEPSTGMRMNLGTPETWFGTLKTVGDMAPGKDVARYAMNKIQSLFDPLFSGVAYVAYDGTTFSGGSNDNLVLPLASLTKLMTALVVIDANLDWQQLFTLTPAVIQYPRDYYPDGGTSEVSFKEGDTVTLQDLRVALLVASSNQSADALATATGLTRAEFLHRMNEKATLFGLTHTEFFDVAGLDVRNVSTPREMAILAQHAFANDMIAQTSVTTDYTIVATQADSTLRPVVVVNRNTSLLSFAPDGAKSGYLVEAQRNAAIRKDGKILIVMHARSLTERNQILAHLVQATLSAAGI